MAATIETKRQIQSLKRVAGMVSERGQKQGRGRKLAEIVRLLSQHFLVEWPPFLEEFSGESGSVMEGSYSLSTFEPLHNLKLGVPKLSRSCLIQ